MKLAKNTSLPTLYSIKVQGNMHFVSAISSSLTISEPTFEFSIVYLFSKAQLSQIGRPSTLNLLQGGWQPAFLMTYSWTQPEKLYSGEFSQGLCGRFSFSCLIGFKINPFKFFISFHFRVYDNISVWQKPNFITSAMGILMHKRQ